jgi:uncharacterized membrane protein YdjX (TVP38/TMEM64 family)
MQKFGNLIYVKMSLMTSKQRKVLDLSISVFLTALIAWAFWSFFQGKAAFDLFANDSSRVHAYLVNLGPWAMFTYVWLCMLEIVVAFIPGYFIYPVGAAIFGLFKSVVLILIAQFVAGSICFWIGRRFGKPLLERFIAPKYITKFDEYIEKNGTWAILILKVNPITSLDIWNYVAGATKMDFWKFTIANLTGILPLTIFSAALGEQTFELAPQILGIMILLTVLYMVWYFVHLPYRISNYKKQKNSDSASS